ncbi:MAG: tetratricopeptide repeat protein [Planctomycetota bacterium]|nr:tetratricopeptide repeat protein [Planctomycetota bacterium]
MIDDPIPSEIGQDEDTSYVATEYIEPVELLPLPSQPEDPGFDLVTLDNPSFAMLEDGQNAVYQSSARRLGFKNVVEELPDDGEKGRRKGLGFWILGEYDACVAQLAKYSDDDVAAFTRAQAFVALRRFGEAADIFERLADKYPTEPRPRGGHLVSRLEATLAKRPDDPEGVAEESEKALEAQPTEFQESVEGFYLAGRVAELRRDWETALDCYASAHAVDPTHRPNLTRAANLAERCGLDDEAIEFYETLLARKPVDKHVLMNIGMLYEDVGRDQEAAACYDVVVRNDPTDQRARLYLTDARAAMDMYYDEDLERKEDRLNQILRIPITDFELSVRARNCLNKMQIQTLGDLVCRTEQELLSYKNFGETSLAEIKEILHSKGLRLGMPREEAVASIEAHARRPIGSDKSDVMNKPIMELLLSIRARRTVEALGCLTAGEVTKHSAEELLGMPNFGQTSLQELRQALAILSLKLKGE